MVRAMEFRTLQLPIEMRNGYLTDVNQRARSADAETLNFNVGVESVANVGCIFISR